MAPRTSRTPIARPRRSPLLPCKQCDVGAESETLKSSALSAELRGLGGINALRSQCTAGYTSARGLARNGWANAPFYALLGSFVTNAVVL